MKIIHDKLMNIEVANALKSILKFPSVVLAVFSVNFRNSITFLLSHGEDVGTRHNQQRDCFNDRCRSAGVTRSMLGEILSLLLFSPI